MKKFLKITLLVVVVAVVAVVAGWAYLARAPRLDGRPTSEWRDACRDIHRRWNDDDGFWTAIKRDRPNEAYALWHSTLGLEGALELREATRICVELVGDSDPEAFRERD